MTQNASTSAQKRFTALPKKILGDGLVLFMAVTIGVSGTVSAYALTQIERPQSVADSQPSDASLSEIRRTTTSSEQSQKPSEGATGEQLPLAEEASPERQLVRSSGASGAQGYSSGTPSDSSRRLVADTTSLSVGGASLTYYAYSNVRSASGALLDYSLSFSRSASYTGERSLWFDGLSVQESDLTNGTQPEAVRTVVVGQAGADSSGDATFYVFSSPVAEPMPLRVTWRPMASYGVTNLGHTRTDTGSAIEHAFRIRIDPNAYFGNPMIEVVAYGAIVSKCGSGSTTSIQSIYSGNRDFTLRCIIPKLVCANNPCPLISDASVSVGVSARTSAGVYIPGPAESLQYILVAPYEYAK